MPIPVYSRHNHKTKIGVVFKLLEINLYFVKEGEIYLKFNLCQNCNVIYIFTIITKYMGIKYLPYKNIIAYGNFLHFIFFNLRATLTRVKTLKVGNCMVF
jgi:hypothetical protein